MCVLPLVCEARCRELSIGSPLEVHLWALCPAAATRSATVKKGRCMSSGTGHTHAHSHIILPSPSPSAHNARSAPTPPASQSSSTAVHAPMPLNTSVPGTGVNWPVTSLITSCARHANRSTTSQGATFAAKRRHPLVVGRSPSSRTRPHLRGHAPHDGGNHVQLRGAKPHHLQHVVVLQATQTRRALPQPLPTAPFPAPNQPC